MTKDHTFSLLSSLSPPSALTIVATYLKNNLQLRIPEHNFNIYEVIPFILEKPKKGLPYVNSHLYNHLFCGFSDYYKESSAIWVGRGLSNPYGVKKKYNPYKHISGGCYYNNGLYEI